LIFEHLQPLDPFDSLRSLRAAGLGRYIQLGSGQAKTLCDRDDYHQYFYFESEDDVKVVSIDDYEQEDGE
jgi:hypothetical protein